MASMDGSFQIVKERKAKRSRLETKIVQLTPFVFSCLKERCGGGADRDRTGDPLLAKQVLSQLSYSPSARFERASSRKPRDSRTEALLRHDHGGSGKTRTSDLTLIRGAL